MAPLATVVNVLDPDVIVLGGGNTAMDCCRTSRRLGGKDIKVMARRPRAYFKASPWELEDAEEEQIDIVINHAPKRFVVENINRLALGQKLESIVDPVEM